MDDAIRQFVRDRAGNRCEYRLLPQRYAVVVRFHIEHLRARQHGGDDPPANLALNQTTRDSYTRISGHSWVACAVRTKRDSATYPCAQRTLPRVCKRCVDRFSPHITSNPSGALYIDGTRYRM